MSSPHGLAYWYAHTAPDAFPERGIAEMMTEPRFEDASRAAAQGALKRRATSPVIARAFRDSGRIFYAMLAIMADARGPVTLSSLQAFSGDLGIASKGRAAAMMIYLRMIGYLERDPVQSDGRTRGYVVAPKMLEAHRLFMCNELEALALIEPDALIAADRLGERAAHVAYVEHLRRAVVRFLGQPSTDTTLFGNRDCGMAILFELAIADPDVYPARGPVPVSVTRLGKTHGVSRSHVRKLLRDAEAAGLLKSHADGRWSLEERLREALKWQHAVSFVGHASCAWRALQAAGDGGTPKISGVPGGSGAARMDRAAKGTGAH